MKRKKPQIYVGSCSWKYESWQGLVYSKPKGINMLEEYSKQFNSVEVDQWFWSLHGIDKISLPREKDVKIYNDSVPDDFKFTIKIPNSITLTHFYRKNKTESLKVNPHFFSPELFHDFHSTLKPMSSKIDVLMFQFEYLNKQKMGSQSEFLDKFDGFLQNIKSNYKLGVELRNPNYLNTKYFEFIERNNIAMVFLQGYYMPPVWDVFNSCKDFLNDSVVIRLHGPDRSGIEEKTGGDWSKIVEPRDGELEKINEVVNYLSSKKVDVYINVNNHFEGSAPLTIQKIKKLMSD